MVTATEQRADGQGIRVDGRCWSVDILENLLTFGQLNAILDTVIDAADLAPGQKMLDVGCGSGRLLIEAARRHPECEFFGIDATPGMIERARESAAAASAPIRFDVGLAQELPFEDASLDAVVSSFLIHHLPHEVARAAMADFDRVLKPGGRLIIADYSRPRSPKGYLCSFPMRFNFYEFVRPQLKGRLDDLIHEQYPDAEPYRQFLGYLPVMRAVKPEQAGR